MLKCPQVVLFQSLAFGMARPLYLPHVDMSRCLSARVSYTLGVPADINLLIYSFLTLVLPPIGSTVTYPLFAAAEWQ